MLGSVGLIHALRPGTIIVDMSDSSPQVGPALARALYSKGAIWIEATPVGGPQELRVGKLTLLAAGAADVIEGIAPILRTFAAKILRLGELGTGPLAKALASAFGAASIAIYTEMLIVAKVAGLDPAGVLDALPLLAPGMGTAPAAVEAQVLTGCYDFGSVEPAPAGGYRPDTRCVAKGCGADAVPAAVAGGRRRRRTLAACDWRCIRCRALDGR